MTTLNLLRRRQSPIDIDAKSAVSTTINPLSFSEHYGHIPENIELSISNQGFTIIPSYKEHNKPNIVGGPLDTAYELQQFHLHWGSGHKGSEHTLNGKHFAIELHAVHFKKNLSSEQASSDPQGLAVIGYFIDISKSSEECIRFLDEAVNLINKDRSDRTVPLTTKFPMNEIIKPFSSNYYTYDGSWTTPPFTENVTWLIPTEILTFPKEYLKSFRKITASNRRELQDRYDRKILHALN